MTLLFEKSPYFTFSQLALTYKNKKSASIVINNKLRQRKIVRIREGVYTSSEKIKELSLSGKLNSFLEFSATNLIYAPSYLSTEYVLFQHAILSENVYCFTCVTTKKTAKFSNALGMFTYQSLKKEFFGDFHIVQEDGLLFYKASPEKALFDYLYFKRGVIFSLDYIRELRLNLNSINFKKFGKIVSKYPSKKVQKIFILLQQLKGL